MAGVLPGDEVEHSAYSVQSLIFLFEVYRHF